MKIRTKVTAAGIIFLLILVSVFPVSISEDKNNYETQDDDWWIFPERQDYQVSAKTQFNWSTFWQVFKNHSLWMLEGYNPNTEEWVNATNLLTVNITHPLSNTSKIGLIFTTPDNGVTTDWRFTLAIDYQVKKYVNRSGNHEYTLTFEKDNVEFNVIFNWSDMLQYQGLIFTHGVKQIQDKDYFWFRVRRNDVPPNIYVEIDPYYEVYVGTVSFYGNQKKAARISDGTIFVTWYSSNTIYYSNSTNGGLTWSSPSAIADTVSYTSQTPAMCSDSNDVVYIAWTGAHSDSAGNTQVRVANSTDGFDYIANVSEETTLDYMYPSIAVDSEDKLHIVAERSTAGDSFDDQVFYWNSTDGYTWSLYRMLTNEPDGNDDDWFPIVRCDSNDVVHVVFTCEDYSNNYNQILHMKSDDGGDTWTDWTGDPVTDLADDDCQRPHIVFDDDDDAHVVFYKSSLFDICHIYNVTNSWISLSSPFSGETWRVEAAISFASSNDSSYLFSPCQLSDDVIRVIYNYTGAWSMNATLVETDGDDMGCPSSFYSILPVVGGGGRPNVPEKGYSFFYINDTTDDLYYYTSSDLDWEVTGGGNNRPTISNNSPPNQSESVSITPFCDVEVNDTEGDSLSVNWYENTTGSWVHQQTNFTGANTSVSWIFNNATNGGSYYHWRVKVNDSGNSTEKIFNFKTQEDEETNLSNWTLKPGYENCTYGVPDFDQKQDDWKNLVDENWVYCGPVALANCLWWMDCKMFNQTSYGYNTFLPDFYGEGSHDPNNVIPLIDAIAENLSTEKAIAVFDVSGTKSSNFTRGLQWILDNWSYGPYGFSIFNWTTEGENDQGAVTECVNWLNVTDNLSQCHDVILLLGFYCFSEFGFGDRLGGHYVQVNGYDNHSDYLALSFSDPFFDRAEDGDWGWNSPHDHGLYSNGSHNWTQNVSYDFYYINTSSEWMACNASEVIDYTDSEVNWTRMNQFDGMYDAEMPCGDEVRTIIEKAWYVWQDPRVDVYTSIWNVTSGLWENDYENPSVPETVTINISLQCEYPSENNNLTIFTTHYDALEYYVPGSAYVLYPDGPRVQHEPATSWEPGTCSYAPHGHLTWCISSDNLTNWHYDDNIYIEFNMTVNSSNYSVFSATAYICQDDNDCTDCIWNNLQSSRSNTSVNPLFATITCPFNSSEYSDWFVSEHVNRPCVNSGCLDEVWQEYETEYDRWSSYNSSSSEFYDTWRDWEWVYRYDNIDGDGLDGLGLSYSIANNSCANRTQSILRMRYNLSEFIDEEGGEPENGYFPYIGIIYNYINETRFDMALYSFLDTLILISRDGEYLRNTNDSSIITQPEDLYEYFPDVDWPCNSSQNVSTDPELYYDYSGGIWVKTLWNTHCARLSTKAWNITDGCPFCLCDEPSGWIYDGHPMNYSNITFLRDSISPMDIINLTGVVDIIEITGQGYTYREWLDYEIESWNDSRIVLDWGPSGFEPPALGECNLVYVSRENISAKFPEDRCFGLAVFDPYKMTDIGHYEFWAEFDFIEEWKLNYTTPKYQRVFEEEDSGYSYRDVAFMNFNAFPHNNYSAYLHEWNTSYQWPYENETITAQQYADGSACFFRDISKLYNFESRSYYAPKNCSDGHESYDNQNDSVYYYAGLVTNVTIYNPGNLLDNAVILQIIDTTDGHIDWGDGAVVCIDVDNDSEWDDNDICFVWWDDLGTGTVYYIWNGTTKVDAGYEASENYSTWFMANYSDCPYDWLAAYTIDEEVSAILPSNHRSSTHRVYSIVFPPELLLKENGEFLNTSDTFGLHIMTVDAGISGVPPGESLVTWQEWNETGCRNRYTTQNGTSGWYTFLNCSNWSEIEDFYTYGDGWNGVSEYHMSFWGYGKLGNETGYLNQSYFSSSTSVASNISSLENITDDQLVRYDITICNTDETNLTNATVTFQTLTTANIVSSNATSFWNYTSGGYSYHVFNVTNWINVSNCTIFSILVNFTENYVSNGSIVNIWFYSNFDQPGAGSEANYSFDYGENSPPVINWTYPSGDSVDINLVLNNISCYIYDNDGDNMDVYFYTNKSGMGNQTDTWDSTINCIGSNKTVSNGHYWWNQTTNKTDRYCTKWRWGGTYYTFYVNVTDGKTWTNDTFVYMTEGSRYDVTTSGDVVATDASKAWTYRTGETSYLGIYDVNGGGDITATDASLIWSNRT